MNPKPQPQATVRPEVSRHPKTSELRGWGFRLPLPQGWVDRSIYCAAGPLGDGIQATISIAQETTGQDLEEFVTEQLQQLSGQLEEFSLIKREKRAFRGAPCAVVQLIWRDSAGTSVQQSQWYFRGPRCVYAITATAQPSEFSKLDSELARLISEFAPSSI
jgi:hypothetical protein